MAIEKRTLRDGAMLRGLIRKHSAERGRDGLEQYLALRYNVEGVESEKREWWRGKIQEVLGDETREAGGVQSTSGADETPQLDGEGDHREELGEVGQDAVHDRGGDQAGVE